MSTHSKPPFRWFNNNCIVRDEGNRPVVLISGQDGNLKQRDSRGVLVNFDRNSPDGVFILKALNSYSELIELIGMIDADIDMDDLSVNFSQDEFFKLKNLLDKSKALL